MEKIEPTETTPPTGPPLFLLSSLVDALGEDGDARRAALLAGRPLGPVSGLPSLDTLLGGALAPGLHILHGSPGVGKTAFALQVGASCQFPCLYVTAEMSPVELLRRHTARVTSTFLGKFKSGELTGDTIRDLAKRAVLAAPNLALMDATEIPAPPAHLLTIGYLLKKHMEASNMLLVVDSLHSWADGLGGGETEYDRLNESLAALRTLAKRLSCPVLAIAERNRASRNTGGMAAGAGTRKIEYGAETVIELDADGDTRSSAEEQPVKLSISKNRNGPAGKPVEMSFNGALQRYREWAA